MLAISSQLKDYRLVYFVNEILGLELQKYDDFKLSQKGEAYSWYCYSEGENGTTFYLIGNHHPNGKLLPTQKSIDYFLFTKNLFDEHELNEMASKLRTITGIQAVFRVDMATIKNLDLMIENLELHELEKVIMPRKEESGIKYR